MQDRDENRTKGKRNYDYFERDMMECIEIVVHSVGISASARLPDRLVLFFGEHSAACQVYTFGYG